MHQGFLDYYRCPEVYVDFRLTARELDQGTGKSGEGRSAQPEAAIVVGDGFSCLPFNPTEVANELRYERYVDHSKKRGWKSLVRNVYYALRPMMPVKLRRHLQKTWLKGWEKQSFPSWPLDCSVDLMFERLMGAALEASKAERIPFVWFWPMEFSSCGIMTHDVETGVGLKFCEELMNINEAFGVKSSFQLIPDARYVVSDEQLRAIKSRGFEVNVHDLKHDGHLFDDYQSFQMSARRINEFGERFESKGFRSAVLYRNQDWFDALKFSYDMSVPNVAHLDPQRGGCCTVMPYFVGDVLELPVTATQDYTLFHILGTYSIELWRKQMDLIMEQHGLMSFIVHPDYLDSPAAVDCYKRLLGHLTMLKRNAGVWLALPGEVDSWWRKRSKMTVVPTGDGWRVEGEGAESARVAFATLKDDKVIYEFA